MFFHFGEVMRYRAIRFIGLPHQKKKKEIDELEKVIINTASQKTFMIFEQL